MQSLPSLSSLTSVSSCSQVQPLLRTMCIRCTHTASVDLFQGNLVFDFELYTQISFLSLVCENSNTFTCNINDFSGPSPWLKKKAKLFHQYLQYHQILCHFLLSNIIWLGQTTQNINKLLTQTQHRLYIWKRHTNCYITSNASVIKELFFKAQYFPY